MSADPHCPDPPAPAAALRDHDALPPGTRFGEFEIIRVLGVGGFGIVYLAQDHSLERQVALKEHMPASLAARGDGPLITVRSSSFVETYAIGLRSFINEARLLARFDHPSLVKVYRFWEDNATAYMVMPYLQGITLRDARRAMTHAPDEAWLRGVLDPMLDALEQLHGEGVFHRDIAPDNILLPPVGAPILLDFGAARRVISDRTQSLTAILKPSYAPIEQYADMTAMRQGPWTDLYALGAVMHFLLFGAPPAPATARALQGDAGQIEQRVVPGVSPRFLSVVAWMLGVRPLERPQSVAALRAVLQGDAPMPSPARTCVTAPGDITSIPVASAAVPLSEGAPDPAFEPTMLVDRVHALPTQLDTGYRPTERAAPQPAASLPASSGPPPPGRRRGAPGAFVAAAVVAAAVVVWQLVGLLGGMRAPGVPVDPAGNVASDAIAAAVGGVASSVDRDAQSGVHSRAGEAPAAAKPGVSPVAGEPLGAEVAAPSLGSVVGAAGPLPVVTVASPPAAAASRPRPVSRPNGVRTTDPAASVVAKPAMPVAADEAQTRSAAAAGAREPTQATNPNPNPIAAAAPIGPATASEACGTRVFIALAVCMDRECERPQFRDSPACVRVLNVKRQRAER